MADDIPEIATIVVAAPPLRPGVEFEGRPVLATVLEMVAGWGLATPTTVVLDPTTEYLIEEIDLGGATAVVDEDGGGRSAALSVGLAALARLLPDAVAALIVDGDTPNVPGAAVTALAAELVSSEAMAVVPTYRYVRGGPVLVARQLWDRIMASDHDQRLDEMLAAHPEWTARVVISEPPPQPVA